MVSRTGLNRTLITRTLIALLAVLLWAPVATSATAQAAPAAPAAGDCRPLASGASAAAERAIAAACAEVAAGTWYTWGGGHGPQPGATYGQVDPTDPASEHDPERRGFDCSGLVRHAYAQATGGTDILNGVASQQFYTHRAAARFTAAQGLAPLLPGDLLAYGTKRDLQHIAIYLGAGKMVEARQSGTKLMVSDVRLGSTYFGAVRVNTGAVTGHIHQTWGTDVWTKAEPRLAAERVYAFPYSTTIRVHCQKHADNVNAEGYENDVWSYLPDYKAWVTNIYIKGPAWLEGVPNCDDVPPAP
ncbi:MULTISPECIES: C40 family peptidase [Streptomyces]|uniref:NlpC/P60 family protein n=1 Tax=Streptomyces caniscabiei TaxID=2746961 RepID=A0ABU4MN72_9ACTN|nr:MULTISPECIES: NlpC/P60 family protein [Streptomyces]MBE4738625.1 C40 family peptidase [Streptomyces caniscabiei]MBE4756578.1 C40 family peptidase [Streptomyces caniscabiei]MBE4768917.1 C40 family peptidase [Streptomyces caniscabiei]MBE4782949.1 C40 family peptidase [Streptomyces caniscabiei]MBE4792253.1 C40 family peptidase [Streptomyces caniscabiei]